MSLKKKGLQSPSSAFKGLINAGDVTAYSSLRPAVSAKTSPLYSVAFQPGRPQVWFSSDEGLHTLTVGEEGVQLALAGLGGGPVFSPGGRWMAVLSSKGIAVWDVALNQPVLTLTGHTGTPTSVAFSPECASPPAASAERCSPRLVTGSFDLTVKVWDLAETELGP